MSESRTIEFPDGKIANEILKAGGYRIHGSTDIGIYERHDLQFCDRVGTLDLNTGTVTLNEKHNKADINYKYIDTLKKAVFV